MRRWSVLAERLAATTRTSEKTALLADYLHTLTPLELPIAAVFLTGRPFPEDDQRSAGLGWSAIATTVRRSPARPVGAGRGIRPALDLDPAGRRLTPAGHEPSGPPRPLGGRTFEAIEAAWPCPQVRDPRDIARLLDPLTAKYIVKVLGGELRIGLARGSGGRDREGVRSVARCRQVGRDADRRHRSTRLAGPR
jgi:DNA ligase-1